MLSSEYRLTTVGLVVPKISHFEFTNNLRAKWVTWSKTKTLNWLYFCLP